MFTGNTFLTFVMCWCGVIVLIHKLENIDNVFYMGNNLDSSIQLTLCLYIYIHSHSYVYLVTHTMIYVWQMYNIYTYTWECRSSKYMFETEITNWKIVVSFEFNILYKSKCFVCSLWDLFSRIDSLGQMTTLLLLMMDGDPVWPSKQ